MRRRGCCEENGAGKKYRNADRRNSGEMLPGLDGGKKGRHCGGENGLLMMVLVITVSEVAVMMIGKIIIVVMK